MMPPKYVQTIREEICYEYAKLMSRSAYAGKLNYGFITNRFKDLRDGNMTISGTIKEFEAERRLPDKCVFCGTATDLETDHLIPRSRGGTDSGDNVVLACKRCNASRGNKGIFEWLGLKKKDNLHRLVAGKYLKELLQLHELMGTLDVHKEEIQRLCAKCGLAKVCREAGTEEELTCFCLESILK
jgi:hypothetical protein